LDICPGYNPRQADLVVTGASSSIYRHTSGAYVGSEVHLLRSARMVRLDWQRTVAHPAFLRCLHAMSARDLPAGQRLVSTSRLRVPRLAPYASGVRLVWQVTVAGRRVRVVSDALLLGRGRTEITLMSSAPFAGTAALVRMELRLARRLLSRTSS
jgi:hypothetical protein